MTPTERRGALADGRDQVTRYALADAAEENGHMIQAEGWRDFRCCCWCQAAVNCCMELTAPATDGAWWHEESWLHYEGCEWVLTRGQQVPY